MRGTRKGSCSFPFAPLFPLVFLFLNVFIHKLCNEFDLKAFKTEKFHSSFFLRYLFDDSLINFCILFFPFSADFHSKGEYFTVESSFFKIFGAFVLF